VIAGDSEISPFACFNRVYRAWLVFPACKPTLIVGKDEDNVGAARLLVGQGARRRNGPSHEERDASRAYGEKCGFPVLNHRGIPLKKHVGKDRSEIAHTIDFVESDYSMRRSAIEPPGVCNGAAQSV
jgi:hypothetical protein